MSTTAAAPAAARAGTTPSAVALAFLEAMDRRDLAAVLALCSDDHRFVVNGKVFSGAGVLERIWRGWWALVPDCTTTIREVLVAGSANGGATAGAHHRAATGGSADAVTATRGRGGAGGRDAGRDRRRDGRRRGAVRDEHKVVLHFDASGTHLVVRGTRVDGAWSYPVAVICTIRDDRVAEWREFCGPDTLARMEELVRAGA